MLSFVCCICMTKQKQANAFKQKHALRVMKKDTSELKIHYKSLKKEIKQRLRQFSALPASDYFYELCFCLLTPQSNAKKCWQAVEKLKKCRLQDRNINSIKIEKCLK